MATVAALFVIIFDCLSTIRLKHNMIKIESIVDNIMEYQCFRNNEVTLNYICLFDVFRNNLKLLPLDIFQFIYEKNNQKNIKQLYLYYTKN